MFKHNSGWENRGEVVICRWIMVWQEIGNSKVVGACGGYSGGGAFQLEEFVALYDGHHLLHCYSDLEDRITKREINFYTDMSSSDLSLSSKAIDSVMEWIIEEEWHDADQLILRPSKLNKLDPKGEELLTFSLDSFDHLKEILGLHGVTASP